MKTRIICASLYLSERFVREVPWKQFVLLFSDADGIIGVRQQWSQVNNELGAELALIVKSHGESNGWAMSIHPGSPVSDVERIPLSGELMLASDHLSYERDPWILRSGRPVVFRTPRALLRNKSEAACEGPPPEVYFPNMPDELFPVILSHLPIRDRVQKVPFVSGDFYSMLKTSSDCWKKIHFIESMLPCMDDLEAICRFASAACTEISWTSHHASTANAMHIQGFQSKFMTLVVATRWPEVRKLTFKGDLKGYSESVLNLGLRRGNFPALESVACFVPHPQLISRFHVLENSHLPTLTELALCVKDMGYLPYSAGQRISFQFIEKLRLYSSSISMVFTAGMPTLVILNCVPRLRELSFIGNFDVGFELDASFVDKAVRHLVIRRERKPLARCYSIPAVKVLQRFTELETLSLVHCYWSPVTRRRNCRTSRVRGLLGADEEDVPNQAFFGVLKAISLPELGKMVNDVPFGQMWVLEEAWVGLNSRMCSGSVAQLLKLPMLRVLRFDLPRGLKMEDLSRGLASDESIEKQTPPPGRPLQALELEWKQKLDMIAARNIGDILDYFLNIRRLSLHCTLFNCVRTLVEVIHTSGKQIVRLEITWSHGGTPHEFLRCVRDIHRHLRDVLNTDWVVVSRKYGPAGMVSAHFEREGSLEGWRPKNRPFEAAPARMPWEHQLAPDNSADFVELPDDLPEDEDNGD